MEVIERAGLDLLGGGGTIRTLEHVVVAISDLRAQSARIRLLTLPLYHTSELRAYDDLRSYALPFPNLTRR